MGVDAYVQEDVEDEGQACRTRGEGLMRATRTKTLA